MYVYRYVCMYVYVYICIYVYRVIGVAPGSSGEQAASNSQTICNRLLVIVSEKTWQSSPDKCYQCCVELPMKVSLTQCRNGFQTRVLLSLAAREPKLVSPST